jgi:hypothetical protein
MASGRLNQKMPKSVWLYILFAFIRKKYSKSGVILPITNPVREKYRLWARYTGNTKAGCESVKGMPTTET